MDGIIDDNKLLEWGRMVYEKAKLIRKYEIHHHNKLSEFLDEIKKNNDIVELDLNKLRGYTLKGCDLRGHILSDNCTVVNVYWLESILNFHKYKHYQNFIIFNLNNQCFQSSIISPYYSKHQIPNLFRNLLIKHNSLTCSLI